ncbi:MAG TPA: HisA/HisF-related TIM barrel protein [Ktedonobacterales bacterium]|nr:HisA/HisF-related TIM barrel protein [Ktedonobacterales bacterium]
MTERVLYPVIDLLGGRLVRALRDSDEGPALVDDDPISVAMRWREQGARWLHLVDLDGAREGTPRQLDAIRAIIQAVGLPTQVAGGLRDTASVEAALEAGAARVVLSAATPDEQALVAECVVRWGERIAVALEARDGRVTVAGWLPSDAATALDVARAMGYLGAETLLFTSAATTGDNDPLPARLRRVLPEMRLITGGAVSSLDDLRRLLALGMNGVLLGRALRDGLFSLDEALAVAREAPEFAPTPATGEDEEQEPEWEADTVMIAVSGASTGLGAAESAGAVDGPEAPVSGAAVEAPEAAKLTEGAGAPVAEATRESVPITEPRAPNQADQPTEKPPGGEVVPGDATESE